MLTEDAVEALQNKPVEVEIFLVMNEDGDCAVSLDGFTEAREKLEEDVTSYAVRSVALVVKMKPAVVTNVDVVVPDEEEGETTVAAEGGASEAL